MNALVRNLLLVLLAVGTIAAAGDPAAARQEGAPPPTEPVPAPETKPTPTPTPTPTADPEEQLEEFVPSERLPADESVAFPVDI
jgi:hypothetical protein